MTASSSTIRLNGDSYELPSGSSVLALLEALGHDPRTVAIELNGDVLPRPRYGEVSLVEGDRVEVVRFVQGG